MKIALYAGSLTKGGTERVLVTLAHNFKRKGHEVVVVTTAKAPNEYALDEGIKRIISNLSDDEAVKSRLINLIKRQRKLSNIWNTEKPDVILSFIGKNNFNALLTAGRKNIPVAVSVRADPNMEYPDFLSRFLAAVLYPWASKVILQTRESVNFFSKAIQKKSIILKNPLNPAFFGRERKAYRDREKRIVAVGRVDENKNHKMLIDAFYKISKEIPSLKLVIFGDGELREGLLKYIDELNLGNRVFMPGICDDIPREVENSILFVLPSDTEGVPNTLLEAMAVATASISTDCPCYGPREIISEGVNGFLTPVRDEIMLEDKLRKLLAPDLNEERLSYLEAVGRQGQSFVAAYEENAVAEEWLSCLEKLVR